MDCWFGYRRAEPLRPPRRLPFLALKNDTCAQFCDKYFSCIIYSITRSSREFVASLTNNDTRSLSGHRVTVKFSENYPMYIVVNICKGTT